MVKERKYTEREVKDAISYSHEFYGMHKEIIPRKIEARGRVPTSLAKWIEEKMGWEFDERNARYIDRHGPRLPSDRR